jgi:uncharacterized protein YndB with AHSA1/START domain
MAKHNKTKIRADPRKQEIVIIREFNAPRELVFKAYTDPKLIPQWWGPRRYTTTIDKMEPEKGGMWRFIQNGPHGEFAFNGVYHEVVSPERIIYTFEFEGLPEKGHVLMETIKFEDLGDKTKLTSVSVFQSVEDRDGMLQSGMEEGAVESDERLDELLEKMKKENA